MGFPAPLLVPQFDAAVVSLSVLCLLIVALGFISTVDAIVRALFGTLDGAVGWIPYLGRIAQRPIHAIEHKVVSLVGAAEQRIDAGMGYYLGSLAKLVEWTGQEIRRHANLLSILSTVAIGPAATSLIWSAIHEIRKALHVTHSQVRTVTHTVTHVITRQVVRVERTTVTRIKSASAAVTHVTTVDIPWLRARTRSLEDEYHALAKRIAAGAKALPAAAVAALALAALAKIGAGWLKCSNWQKIGRAGCRLPFHFLEDLLALVVDFVVLTDICEVVGWLEKGLAEVETPLKSLTHGLDKALCHGDYTAPKTLSVPTLYRPPIVSDVLAGTLPTDG
jgi:hypothetical protein